MTQPTANPSEPGRTLAALPLPIGARVASAPSSEVSDELARRIMEAGGSDLAVDAAGGPGAAKRLRLQLATAA